MMQLHSGTKIQIHLKRQQSIQSFTQLCTKWCGILQYAQGCNQQLLLLLSYSFLLRDQLFGRRNVGKMEKNVHLCFIKPSRTVLWFTPQNIRGFYRKLILENVIKHIKKINYLIVKIGVDDLCAWWVIAALHYIYSTGARYGPQQWVETNANVASPAIYCVSRCDRLPPQYINCITMQSDTSELVHCCIPLATSGPYKAH